MKRDGDVFTIELNASEGSEFKLVKFNNETGDLEWENGPNRAVGNPNGSVSLSFGEANGVAAGDGAALTNASSVSYSVYFPFTLAAPPVLPPRAGRPAVVAPQPKTLRHHPVPRPRRGPSLGIFTAPFDQNR